MPDTRLRYLADINPPSARFDSLTGVDAVTFMPLETVWADSRLDTSRVRPRSEVETGYVRFEDGDILVPKVTPTFQAGRATVVTGLVNGAGAGSTELHVLRARQNADSRFLCYVTRSARFISEGVSRFQGVAGLQRVPDLFIRDFPVVDFSLDDQRAIADYLDAQVALVGRAIALRTEQIALLEERRRSRITEVMMGASGGTTVKLKYLLAQGLSYGAGEAAGYDDPSWPRYIRITDIDSDGALRADSFRSLPPETAAPYLLQDGDLLFARSGATVGKCFRYRSEHGPAAYAGYLIRARVDQRKASPDFIRYFTDSDLYWRQISEGAIQATIQNVNAEKYGNILVPRVEKADQERVLRALEATADADRQVRDLCMRQVDLLKERTLALVSAAVAGAFDVTTARSAA